MSAFAAGLGLALLASLALNSSYLLQHAGSHGGPPVTVRRPLVALRGLLSSRMWMAGLALGLSGWSLHVAALSLAPLSLVQAFAAGGLALAAPLGARALRQPLGARERRAIVMIVLALALLAAGAVGGPPGAPPAAGVAAVFMVPCAALAALLAAVRGPRRAHALGAAGGALYGIGDAATKALTAAAHGGLGVGAATAWLAILAGAAAGGFVCFQRGLQLGPAVPVLALMTAATNVVAIGAGLVVFGDPLGAGPGFGLLHALAFVLAGAAAWWLAPAQARLEHG
ncbi:MAG TPA: hypothetical protein VF024_01700 [Solirubrobacteraceae bacterium]